MRRSERASNSNSNSNSTSYVNSNAMNPPPVNGAVEASPRSAAPLSTASPDALQTDMRKIMDVVDELRRASAGSLLQLPQLVVCVDQPSGKSSVLEAITEIPFPRKENLCTRFATEIILRQSRAESISTKIIPDKDRPASELRILNGFKSTISSFEDLPASMDQATKLMGLGYDARSGPLKAFSRDVFSIETSGPGRAQL